MTKRLSIRIPGSHTAPYKAAEHLFKNGPATEEQLFVAVDMGNVACRREEKLSGAITSGLLTQLPDGRIDCSASTRTYFEEKLSIEPEEGPIGEIKPAPTLPQYRGNWRGSTLSKRNIPNSRGLRPASDLAPAWSVRQDVSFHTKA
jgi:hypothetical protein